ncbi:MAG: hypothetical protein U0Z26_06655 [Anaerolineales bacterium]
MEIVNYAGNECCVLENETLRLLVTRSIGPRISYFGFRNGENLFAELPDFVTELPDGGVFHFYGGHRLWHAPEDLRTTYQPDDEPVEITALENGLQVTQAIQSKTGLQKSMDISLAGKSKVIIKHHITNHGLWDVTCAPWAITQLKTGGMAILPQASHDAGVLPNRSLAMWSYTDMSNSNVTWGKDYILVKANMQSAFKVGFPNPRGWLAYWLNGVLFVKHADYINDASYYDFGSSSESYCNDKFLELETLAPISLIHPGNTVTHTETWELHKVTDCPQNENEVQSLVNELNLG